MQPNNVCEQSLSEPPQILFLCLARNCAPTLPAFFRFLVQLRDHDIQCAALVGENSSSDNSRQLIEMAAAADLGVHLLDTSFMQAARDRLSRMAIGRQGLFERAMSMAQRYEFAVVADLDSVMLEPPHIADVKNALDRLRNDRSLFAVGATSRPVYYDLLSLRSADHDYSSLHRDIQEAQKNPLSYFQFHKRRIYEQQLAATWETAIRCQSSFNGFCIYKMTDYGLGGYRSADEAHICEHVTMNLSIGRKTGKEMLIDPDLRLRTPMDHGPVGIGRFWFERVKKRLKQSRYRNARQRESDPRTPVMRPSEEGCARD